MGPLYVLLGVIALWYVIVLIEPRVVWYVQSWKYRDPEQNEPSDTYFAMHRLGAIVMLILIPVGCGMLT
ncbi:DUF6199 family natural product biosynthesis protein [Nocardiopsis alba]|uniref:DUF6199 family natural product biosynthesis protein n=2 Tax=Nocardiopsis alba TaxID=53437 RepID=A0A7K2IQ61_9ACTN|nr:DUF6199 family natural product biosynthesis protein [Nocardiopsis alba]AFR07301.1 putative membrane protein [Nocardiopsis alba ATCC BAA-2165]MYR31934.1 hypothetical protein [Nocardiopsis alba]